LWAGGAGSSGSGGGGGGMESRNPLWESINERTVDAVFIDDDGNEEQFAADK
jgi:hypothetical protein